jgi:hypothetical protein
MMPRRTRLRVRQRRHINPQPASHRVNRDDVCDHADDLDVLLLGETAGDDIAIPTLAEAARIGHQAMHHLDDDLWQSAEAVVRALDR